MDTPRKTGIIYARVSSWEQVSNTSLEKQVKDCLEYAFRNNIGVLCDPFVEEGESAKTTDRPEFQKALAYCAKQKPDFFIVYKIDRFARNQDDHVVMRAYLRKYSTEVRSATEPVDESTIGRLQMGILSVFSEFDNNMRAERSKNGMIEKVLRGEWVWAAPVGYKRIIKGGNLVIDEEFAPYVRLAFEEWSKGIYSFRSLTEFLFERGFRTRPGKKPSMQLLEKMIHNPIYYGSIEAFGHQVKGSFTALISEELFWKCQPGTRKRFGSGERISDNPAFILRKFIQCSSCGSALTGSASRGRGSKKYPYYHHQKQGCSLAKFLPKETAEQNFAEYLEKISPSQIKYQKAFKAIVLDSWQSNYKKLDAENERGRKEISVLETERQRVFDLHRGGAYSDQEFMEQKDLVNLKIHQQKLLLEEKRVEELNMEEALDYCFELVRNSGKTWISLKDAPAYRARFQKMVFPEKVTFDGEKFGTSKTSLVYKLNEEVGSDSSKLVTQVGQNWKQLVDELSGWYTLGVDLERATAGMTPSRD